MQIHNVFWVPGVVPSMNELLTFKANVQPMKKSWLVHKGAQPGTFRFNKYNQVKANWKAKGVKVVNETGFTTVEACYFSYVVVEKTRKRDPSNICASAIKFLEDSLVEAGVIPNDGWNNVLGIATSWRHEKDGEPGVLIVMSDVVLMPCTLETIYANAKR